MHERGRLGLSDNCIAFPAFPRGGGRLRHQREALSIPGYLLADAAVAESERFSPAFPFKGGSRVSRLCMRVVSNKKVTSTWFSPKRRYASGCGGLSKYMLSVFLVEEEAASRRRG